MNSTNGKTVVIALLCVVILVMGILWWWPQLFTESSGVQAKAGEDRTINVNETITFDGSASTVGMTGMTGIKGLYEALLIWDFDKSDGIQIDATGLVINHTYTKAGVYTVTLTVIIYPVGERTFFGADTDTVVITVTE